MVVPEQEKHFYGKAIGYCSCILGLCKLAQWGFFIIYMTKVITMWKFSVVTEWDSYILHHQLPIITSPSSRHSRMPFLVFETLGLEPWAVRLILQSSMTWALPLRQTPASISVEGQSQRGNNTIIEEGPEMDIPGYHDLGRCRKLSTVGSG